MYEDLSSKRKDSQWSNTGVQNWLAMPYTQSYRENYFHNTNIIWQKKKIWQIFCKAFQQKFDKTLMVEKYQVIKKTIWHMYYLNHIAFW